MDYPSPWQLRTYAQLCFILHDYFANLHHKKIDKKLLRNFQEVRNNLETIEKLFRNYREMGNYREIIEKLSKNGEISLKFHGSFREIATVYIC